MLYLNPSSFYYIIFYISYLSVPRVTPKNAYEAKLCAHSALASSLCGDQHFHMKIHFGIFSPLFVSHHYLPASIYTYLFWYIFITSQNFSTSGIILCHPTCFLSFPNAGHMKVYYLSTLFHDYYMGKHKDYSYKVVVG